MRRAARWCHLAAGEMRHDAEFALRWAATWRAAGKMLPRRVGMRCARARRRYRKRNEALAFRASVPRMQNPTDSAMATLRTVASEAIPNLDYLIRNVPDLAPVLSPAADALRKYVAVSVDPGGPPPDPG